MKLNGNKLSQALLLSVLIVLLTIGLVSGTINKYVHTRFNISLWISIVVLLLFLVSIFMEQKKRAHNINYQKYLVYCIPLCCTIMFSPVSTGSAQVVMANNMTGNATQLSTSSEDATLSSKFSNQASASTQDSGNSFGRESDTSNYNNDYNGNGYNNDGISGAANSNENVAGNSTSANANKNTSEAYKINQTDGYYVINDEILGDWLFAMYKNPDDFVGEQYEFTAQVFQMDGLQSNQLFAGRQFMVCCAADMVGYGYICDSPQSGSFSENQWITVKGTVSKGEYQGTVVPKFTDVSIVKTAEPKVDYIYYNSNSFGN